MEMGFEIGSGRRGSSTEVDDFGEVLPFPWTRNIEISGNKDRSSAGSVPRTGNVRYLGTVTHKKVDRANTPMNYKHTFYDKRLGERALQRTEYRGKDRSNVEESALSVVIIFPHCSNSFPPSSVISKQHWDGELVLYEDKPRDVERTSLTSQILISSPKS